MHRTSGVDLHPVNAEAFVPLDSGLDHGKTVCRGSPDARRLFVRRDAARHKNDSRQIEFGNDLLRDDHVPLMHGVESPPKIPILTPTSLEVEHRLADPDLIARHGAGPPQGSEYPGPLQFVLETLDTLPVIPVCLEREPFDVLPRDDVAAVLVLDPDTIPGWPEDAMLTLRHLTDSVLTHLAQPLLEGVAQRRDTFRRGRGDLRSIWKDLPQVRP